MENTTIAAVSTPVGTGGIGIVRLSGGDALAIAQRVFRPMGNQGLLTAKGYTGMLGRIYDDKGDLDEAIAFVYRRPASYTGEDVVELSCHGGTWIIQKVLQLCLQAGAVPASPGEFTKRAFLSGKLALSDAEAVMDLIEAQGDGAARAALSAKEGRLSTQIAGIVENLLAHSAQLAAWADDPDEELLALDEQTLDAVIIKALERMQWLLDTWDQGKLLRDGVETVIVGRPNVGKSTLMNLLAGQQRSIVTDIPGTTRDIVEDRIRLGDLVLHIADTAGIRETDDPIERIGVDLARKKLQSADLILAVFDSSDVLTDEDLALLELLRNRPCVAVVNKIDLSPRLELERIRLDTAHVVQISAKDGQGYEELKAVVESLLQMDGFDPTAAMVYSERQRRCLIQAMEHLGEARDALVAGVTLDAVSVSIDCALDVLLALTGQRAGDAVIDEVFSRFCVGK